MAHRGRLNVLANIVGKSMAQIFSEFEGEPDPESVQGSGDVKYHLGASGIHRSTQGKEILVSVAFNPSHLEAVDPVVEGLVRPKQDRIGDDEARARDPDSDPRRCGVHRAGRRGGSSAAVAARRLHDRRHHSRGHQQPDRIHHQSARQAAAAFTAPTLRSPCRRRSSMSTATIRKPACGQRSWPTITARRFKRDVVIDMIGYRRQGHNEADDPSYTQPVMYRKIKSTPTVATQYAERLVREKFVDKEQVDSLRAQVAHPAERDLRRGEEASRSSSRLKNLPKCRSKRSCSRSRRPRPTTTRLSR